MVYKATSVTGGRTSQSPSTGNQEVALRSAADPATPSNAAKPIVSRGDPTL